MYSIYLWLILYSFFLVMVTKKNKVISEVLGIVIIFTLTIIIGFRYGVGVDYFAYEEAFHLYYNKFFFEPFYSFLNFYIKITVGKFYYVTFIMILITNIFIYLALKKRNISGIYLLLSLLIYSSNMALVFMNAMRQGVAVAIFLYASSFIKERKFKNYLILILIGAGFHFSILFMLPVYFLNRINISIKRYIFYIIISYLFVYTLLAQKLINYISSLLPTRYSRYYNSEMFFLEEVNIFSIGVLIKVVLSIVLLILIVKSNKKNNNYTMETNFYMLGIIMTILSLSTFMFDRIGYFFYIFEVLVIPLLIKEIENNQIRHVLFLLTLSIAVLFFIQNLFINAELLQLEYQSIFDFK